MKWILRLSAFALIALEIHVAAIAVAQSCGQSCPPGSGMECNHGACCSAEQSACGYGGAPSCCSNNTASVCQDAGPFFGPKCCLPAGSACNSSQDCCASTVLLPDGGIYSVQQNICDGTGHCSTCTPPGQPSPDGGGGACCFSQVNTSTNLCCSLSLNACSQNSDCCSWTPGLNPPEICSGSMCCLTGSQTCMHNTDCCSNSCDHTNRCTVDTTCH